MDEFFNVTLSALWSRCPTDPAYVHQLWAYSLYLPVFAFLLQGCQDGPSLAKGDDGFSHLSGHSSPFHKWADFAWKERLVFATSFKFSTREEKGALQLPRQLAQALEGKVLKYLQCYVYEEELFCYYSYGGIITWVSVEMWRRKEMKETLCLHPLPT